MFFVLTESSTISCSHMGTVKLIAGQSKLVVKGNKVMVDGDLNGAVISGCTTIPDPNTTTVKCLSVSTVVGGVAENLKVSGKGVLLENIQGQTNGTVSGVIQTWSVQNAGQTLLKTL